MEVSFSESAIEVKQEDNALRHKQADGVYYKLDDKICVKIHTYILKVYVDLRKYKMNPHENTIVTNWDPATEINGVQTAKILSGQLNAHK